MCIKNKPRLFPGLNFSTCVFCTVNDIRTYLNKFELDFAMHIKIS